MRRCRIRIAFPTIALLIGSAVFVGCTDSVLRVMGRQVESAMRFDLPAELPDGLHVLVCGSGGPLPAPNRTSTCLAVIAGDTVFLVDVGAGSARTMALAGLQPGRIERVFLTHFHSDHIDGLGEMATLRWAAGDWSAPLPVHGPDGVDEIVSGFNLAYRHDQTYRAAHHGPEVTPVSGAGLSAYPFASPAGSEAVTVFEQGELRVTAFAVDHEPVNPAVGYRIEYKDRSVVISGDTAKSSNLIAHARGADVLFHEALSKRLVGVLNQSAQNVGNANLAKISADILDYHASPVEAAESAQEADVDVLVLYHIVPPLPIRLVERIFMEGTSDAFGGRIELAVDGELVSLPAGSDEIEFDERL